MKNKKYAEVKISKGMKLRYFTECGHIVLYNNDYEVIDSANGNGCEYVEVSVYEENEDEKR